MGSHPHSALYQFTGGRWTSFPHFNPPDRDVVEIKTEKNYVRHHELLGNIQQTNKQLGELAALDSLGHE